MTQSSPEALLEASSLFDADWYQAQYPDVAALELSAVKHYLQYGWRLGRNPSAGFYSMGYLEDHPDIRQAEANPLLHYLLHGQQEGRRMRPVPADTLIETTIRQRGTRQKPTSPPLQTPCAVSASEENRLSQQLSNTQQLLEHYFIRCQELEYQLIDSVI